MPEAQLVEMTDTIPTGTDPAQGYGLGLLRIRLRCGVDVWGHTGEDFGYHTIVAKPAKGPAISVTFTQSPPSNDSGQNDSNEVILDTVYCQHSVP
jgi:D-alanyl-D-alanine carboxypeptidase